MYYCDEQLMEHCKSFIRIDLNEWTLFTYLPLIEQYKLDEMNDKLVELTIKNVLPKNKNHITKFLKWFSEQQSSCKTKNLPCKRKKSTEIDDN